MKAPKATDVKRGISVIRENLQCPICLDLLTMPVSTKCDHQFCRFCMMKLLDRNKEANCPVCKAKVTKRSLQESPGFQRLVEGLQHMVQAYEEDTSTDYFTGASQRLEHPRCQKAGPRKIQCNRGKTSSCDSQGVDSADSSRSRGPKEDRNSLSSVEAQKRYAKLMDLGDSCGVILDKDGFDIDLPNMPQASEMETDDKCLPNITYLETSGLSVEVTNPLGTEIIKVQRTKKDKSNDASHQQGEGSEEVPKKTDRRPRRATKIVGSDPEKISDKRCRRSLQKVSEWLLKISPMEVEEDSDGCVSDGGSSSSTVKENKDEEQPLTLRKDDHNKSLEDQVFGAVYRRDRKSMGNQLNRTLPPESGGVTAVPACHPPEVVQIQKMASNRRTSGRLAPADVDKMYNNEEKEEETQVVKKSEWNESTVEPIKGQIAEDRAKEEVDQTELGSHDSYRKKMEQVELPEGEDVAEDSPVFEVSLQRTTKRARSNVGSTWKEVDNLRQDGSGESGNDKQSKRKRECRTKENRLAQMKSAKVARPLDLVSIRVDEYDPAVMLEKGPLVDTEAQIESYPSSEGLGSPSMRVTRQSKRLQVFTEEVQVIRKKTRSARSTKSIVPHLDKAPAGEKVGFEKVVMGAECSTRKGMENNVMRNGCIVDGEMADIEKMESSFSEDVGVQCEQKESPNKESFSLSAVPNSESFSDVNIQYATLKGIHPAPQASQDHPQEDVLEIHSSVENFVCKVNQVNLEEDEKNDSEQDTEQLLKTFKATKRRSFQLGTTSSITSDRGSTYCDKQNEEGAPEVDFISEDMNPDKYLESSCLMETVKHAEVQQNQETLCFGMQSPAMSRKNEVENSLCSDLIPPTNLSSHSLHEPLHLKKSHILTGDNSNEIFEECSHSDTGKSPEAKPTGDSDIGGHAIRPDEATLAGRKRRNSETNSRLSMNSQTVDSVLLFPALIASEEEPKDSPSDINNMSSGEVESQKSLKPSTSEDSENNAVFKQGMVEFACPVGDVVKESMHGSHALHCRHQAKLPNSGTDIVLVSSMTPDDLLPPNVVVSAPSECILTAGQREGAQTVEDTTQWSSEGGPTLRKRKRLQRLESSESEASDVEDQLPSFAQLFGQNQPKQPSVEKPIPLSVDQPPGHAQASTEDPAEAAPVVLKIATGNTSPISPSPEWVPASQGSVDLFDTPEEREGLPDDRSHSVESSQFSNEIIATQDLPLEVFKGNFILKQKVAMQEELRRLEEMMALVSEALHKKADASQTRITGKQASPQHLGSAALRVSQDQHQSPPCCDRTRQGLTRRKSLPASALSPVSSPSARTLRSGRGFISPLPAPGATAGPSPAQPGSTENEGKVEAGRRCSRSSRSLKSSGIMGGNTASRGPVIQDDTVQTCTAAPSLNSLTSQAYRGTMRGNMVLVASGLSGAELSVVKKFSKKTGGSLSAQVTPETTHVIIRTDENLVCERTLKYFLGIAARKWVVSFQWIVECFNHGKVLNEAAFEVRGDVVNGQHHQGPMKARTSRDQKLLMSGYEVCFQGSFTDMTTGQMVWMAELCGAKVVKDPLLFAGKQKSTQLVVVQPDSEESHTGYRALQKRAAVVSRGWLLDSVATYTLQNTDEYGV
ncbi:hypothetical protein SKAU_G00133560 [Synaphobranchus kaupii]|uniref:RING-type E3 ubiquitin transferase BRCA1 n=1 Tax=Synaphobranchus kaupii TaxID=118154 RepID=A0A9Q1FQW3_SYNKA|nr:hypothetical protein SKAU_G00133560 [Synaphobranchus kaupii]